MLSAHFYYCCCLLLSVLLASFASASTIPLDLSLVLSNGTKLNLVSGGVVSASALASVTLGPHDHPVTFQWTNTATSTPLYYSLLQDFFAYAPTSLGTPIDLGTQGGSSDAFALLAPSGTVPTTLTAFNASHACSADVNGKLRLIFDFSNSSGTLLTGSPLVLDIPWDCVTPGCEAGCTGAQGTCDQLAGECICANQTYTGTSCSFILDMTPTPICPGSTVSATFTKIGASNHQEWYNLATTDGNTLEWRYIETQDWSGGGSTTANPFSKSWTFVAPLDPNTYLWTYWLDDSDGVGTGGRKFEVLPWTSCGYSPCNKDSDCEGSDSTCDTSVTPHACVCGRNRAGGNCSHGCAQSVEITDNSGHVYSDFGSNGVQSQSLYYYQIACRWIVNPGKDSIKLTFDWMDIAQGDSLKLLDENGQEIFNWGGTSATPAQTEVIGKFVTFQLIADGINTARGFSVHYEGVQKPLGSGAVAAITACCVVFGVVGITLLLFLGRWEWKHFKEQKELAKTIPAAIWQNMEAEAAQSAADVSDIEQYGIIFHHATAGKGYLFPMGKETFPVRQLQTDTFDVKNTSRHPVDVEFFVPPSNTTFELSVVPGKIHIEPGTGQVVQASFRLLYTTTIRQLIKVVAKTGKRVNTGYLGISFTGSLSTYLDPEAIMVETKQLGSGEFGAVYKGTYRERPTAVKVLWHQSPSPREFKAFTEETELLTQLHSPYLVEFFGAVHVPGRLCLCFELLPTGDLAKYIEEYQIPFHLQAGMAENIAQALSFLNNHNILYRDLKPGNILLTSHLGGSQIKCKLGDLGSARPVEDVKKVMQHPSFAGTLIYTAPEILISRPYNNKIDVYSFGLLMWEMATGEQPWSAIPLPEVYTRVPRGERPDLAHKALQNCDPSYLSLIQQCWSDDPASRPEFDAIVALLQRIVSESKTKEKPTRRIDTSSGKEGGHPASSDNLPLRSESTGTDSRAESSSQFY